MNPSFPPRFIRLRDAAYYLGMDRNRFSKEVRPYVTEIRIGVQGIAFDRNDLDAWADQYKLENGRLGRQVINVSSANKRTNSINTSKSATSDNSTSEELSKLLKQAGLQKRKWKK